MICSLRLMAEAVPTFHLIVLQGFRKDIGVECARSGCGTMMMHRNCAYFEGHVTASSAISIGRVVLRRGRDAEMACCGSDP